MEIEARQLDGMSRDALIELARRLGARRAEMLTRVELKDEILRLGETDENKRRRARGFFGVARDLVAGLVERGLNMPDAAALIRGETILESRSPAPPPVATVTLAEIYAAQGHTQRALSMLDEVLAREPDHEIARRMSVRISSEVAASSPTASLAPIARPPSEPPPVETADTEGAAAALLAELARSVSVEPARAEPSSKPERPPAADVVVTLEESDAIGVYWELTAATRARAARRAPGGAPVIRLVVVSPDWRGARRVEREIFVDAPCGSARVAPAPGGALVRAALGWATASGFAPFVIGTPLVTPSSEDDLARRALTALRSARPE
ncbi:MAG: hypothetical protein OZ921_02930 [Sorangiineae bacterium]|nr:hypothetical protein [Polyangiaceae bacterium]MEB2321442.1 hypothetical protein [Sorangiineae bacterium]